MKQVVVALLIFLLGLPAFAQAAGPDPFLQLARGGQRFGGFRGRGKAFGFHRKGRAFRRGDLTEHFYYRYPRYFYRNFGGIRKFHPRQDRPFYPNQGGSDYREWFDFPRR